MVQPSPVTIADVIERCASDLHSVAFDFREPARCIAEVERICEAARRAVRG